MYINEKTFEFTPSDTIPKGIDWIEVPDETELIYYFDGSDPIGEKIVLFYKKGLSATWWSFGGVGYWDDNVESTQPTFDEIRLYVTTYGRLIWCKEQLLDGEVKTVKYLNRKTHEVFESSEDLDNKDYLLLPNDVETIVVDDDSIGLFKDGYCTYLYEYDVFREWCRDNCGIDYYLEAYKSTKVIWSKSDNDPVSIEETEVDDVKKNTVAPIKSDGGSSGYYFTKLPPYLIDQIVETGGIEIKDIVRYCFDNDADCKDIIKALKRINESKKGGGKEGITIDYDLKKIGFFYNEMVNAHLKTKEENV